MIINLLIDEIGGKIEVQKIGGCNNEGKRDNSYIRKNPWSFFE